MLSKVYEIEAKNICSIVFNRWGSALLMCLVMLIIKTANCRTHEAPIVAQVGWVVGISVLADKSLGEGATFGPCKVTVEE